jgi:acyl carrier protein
VSPDEVRRFLAEHFATELEAVGVEEAGLAGDFDLLIEGVMDSLGFLQLVASLDEHFGVTLDLEALDAEELTKVGPLSMAVADQASSAR